MSMKDRLEKIRAAKRARQSATSAPLRDTTIHSGQDDSRAFTTSFQQGPEGHPAIAAADEGRRGGSDTGLGGDSTPLSKSPEPSLETPPAAKPPRDPTFIAKSPAQSDESPAEELSLGDSAVQSVESAGVAIGDARVSSPGSGVFDETTAQIVPPPPPQPREPPPVLLGQKDRKKTEIQAFIEEVRESVDSPKAKEKLVVRYYMMQKVELKKKLGPDCDEKRLSRFQEHSLTTHPDQRTVDQQHAADIHDLDVLRTELGAEAVNAMRGDRQNGDAQPQGSRKATDRDTMDLGPQAAAAQLPQEEPDYSDEMPTQTFERSEKKKRKGTPKNLLKTPMTYLATGFAACTGILIYRDAVSNDGFQTLADASQWLINDVLQRGPVEVAKHWAGIAYGAVFASIALVTEWMRHREARKDAVVMQSQDNVYSQYPMQRDYIIEEFTKILRKHPSTDAQKMEISRALSEDEELLAYSDLFYQNYFMMQKVFDAVNLHDDVRKDFDIRLRLAERTLLMKKYFRYLGANLNNRLVRMDQLKGYRAKSPFFRKKLDELFSKKEDGSLSDLYKSLVVLKFDTEPEPQVMPALMEKLDRDYKRILDEESAARKQS
jgi:hypothetical protein